MLLTTVKVLPSEAAQHLANHLAADVLRFGDVEYGEHTAGYYEPILDHHKLAEVIQQYWDSLL